MRRALPLFIAAALVLVAAALSGCGHAEFTGGVAPDLPQLAADAGLVIIDQGSAENRYPGGTAGEWYALASEGADEAEVVVNVLRFDDQAARDAAFSQISSDVRRGTDGGVIYTVGDAVVEVDRVTDYGVLQDLDDALQVAGAQ